MVWQIAVPQDYALILLLKSIDLEPPTDGGCVNDFVSYYIDDEVPTKSCSTVEEMKVFKVGARKFTFRFKSNGAKNAGGFYAGVLLLHNDSEFVQYTVNLTLAIQANVWHVMMFSFSSAVIDRVKKDTEDRSDDGSLDFSYPSNRIEQFLVSCMTSISNYTNVVKYASLQMATTVQLN